MLRWSVKDCMTDENDAGWSKFFSRVAAECRQQRYFLGRAEERGLRDQAGDDWRAGDQMVDSMNRIAGLARDRALAALETWQPPAGDLPARIGAAIAVLEGLPDHCDFYGSFGLACVIARLRRG